MIVKALWGTSSGVAELINADKGASSRECIIWKLDRACTFCSCVGGSACVLIKLCGKLIYSLSDSTTIVKSPLLFLTKAVLTFYQKRRSSAHQNLKKKKHFRVSSCILFYNHSCVFFFKSWIFRSVYALLTNFFFWIRENLTLWKALWKAHFVSPDERVKPRLSQALIRDTRPNSNSRSAV